MNDADTGAEHADESAREADNKTDEQVWDEIETQEKAAEPEDDHDEGIEPEQVEATGEEGLDPEPSDEDQIASTDDGDGAEVEANPDGMEPEAVEAQNKRLLQSFKSDQGRRKALQRKTEILERQIIAAEKRPQLSDRDETSLKDRREKLAVAREEYGEVINPVLDEVDDLRADQKRRDERSDERDNQAVQQDRDEFRSIVTAATEVFEDEHPDGLDVIIDNREVFDEWVDDQRRELRDIYAKNRKFIVDGTDASYLVGMFKQALLDVEGTPAPANPETEKLQHRRQRQLAGARSIRTPSRQQASSRPAADSEDAQAHWDYFERQDREKR